VFFLPPYSAELLGPFWPLAAKAAFVRKDFPTLLCLSFLHHTFCPSSNSINIAGSIHNLSTFLLCEPSCSNVPYRTVSLSSSISTTEQATCTTVTTLLLLINIVTPSKYSTSDHHQAWSSSLFCEQRRVGISFSNDIIVSHHLDGHCAITSHSTPQTFLKCSDRRKVKRHTCRQLVILYQSTESCTCTSPNYPWQSTNSDN
jgi:hypothetical protein